jgi:hypothetical protein
MMSSGISRALALLFVLLTLDVWAPPVLGMRYSRLQEPRSQRPTNLLRKAQQVTGLATTPLRTLRLVGRVRSGIDTATAAPLQTFKQIDIRLVLPDHYLRIEQNAQIRRTTGFTRARGILKMESLDDRVRVGQGTPDAEYSRLMRLEIARLLLGFLGDTCGTLRMSSAPLPQRASSVQVRIGDVRHELDVDPGDGMPSAVRYPDTVAVWEPLQR